MSCTDVIVRSSDTNQTGGQVLALLVMLLQSLFNNQPDKLSRGSTILLHPTQLPV